MASPLQIACVCNWKRGNGLSSTVIRMTDAMLLRVSSRICTNAEAMQILIFHTLAVPALLNVIELSSNTDDAANKAGCTEIFMPTTSV